MNHPETGPEHFAEAQRLLRMAQEGVLGTTMLTDEMVMRLTAGAQVHATLALAYATAMQPGIRNGWVPGFTDDRNRDD